ncbi:cold-shock protein [Bradyrhizobium sp. C9]|nr:cold-shock protein [Bradyrhizobium sp. C9]
MPTGRISRVSYQHNFGIIQPDEGGQDVFVNLDQLEDVFPAIGLRLAFDLAGPADRPYAINVRQAED